MARRSRPGRSKTGTRSSDWRRGWRFCRSTLRPPPILRIFARPWSIGAYDLMIDGHARSRGLVVVTGNLGEFQRVEGLRAEDWLTS